MKGLFHGYWFDMDGRKIKRATRRELVLAYKIWATNQDIREGKVG